MNERAKIYGSREVDPDVEQDGEFGRRQENSDPTAIPTNPTTLGALFQIRVSTKPKDPRDSPTTPLAFVSSPGRGSIYSRSSSSRIQTSNDPTDSPTTPTTPSPLGSPARRLHYARSQSMNGASFATPSGVGSPGRTSPFYARSQSINGRIQKPSFRRSQSLNAKYGLQSRHMETLQSQLYSKMRTSGVDHQTVVERLEKLNDLHLNQGDQSRPGSPLSSSQQSFLVEDQPRQDSTIALLQYKFAQLERFRESSQGQQIPLYPPQIYHMGNFSCSDQRAQASSCPRVAPSSDSSYEFDDTTAAVLALQQELMWNSSYRPQASEVASNSNESVGSRSPIWYAAGCESPTSSSSAASRGDEFTSRPTYALAAHDKLPPLKVGRQSNLGALGQDARLRGTVMGNTSTSGGCTESTLVSLFSAERMESLAETKFIPKATASEEKMASSIEMAMANLSFSLTPKPSSLKQKVQGWTRGTSLSLKTPFFADHSQGGSGGSEMPATCCSIAADVQSSKNPLECHDYINMEHQEVIDTSLRL